jgi:hypothetical protein
MKNPETFDHFLNNFRVDEVLLDSAAPTESSGVGGNPKLEDVSTQGKNFV